jgi:hypothetical protein
MTGNRTLSIIAPMDSRLIIDITKMDTITRMVSIKDLFSSREKAGAHEHASLYKLFIVLKSKHLILHNTFL